ncbi:MAG: hypothetical protein J5528_02125 [Firmicutes bacterium]|nr:hypothetical protein [Bacillota bacterium]
MKKLLAVLLVLAMMFSFAACGSSGESAQQSQEQEIEKPSETQNDVNSRDKNIGGIYSLTVPDDWERNDDMQAWLTPDGTVAVYFYTIATSYGDISMPAGLSIDDSNFEDEYVKYLQAIYEPDGIKVRSGIGYNLMTDSKVKYHQGLLTYTYSDNSTSSSIVNIYDYTDTEFFVVEYAYATLRAQNAIECSNKINDTIKKLK